MRKIYIVLSLFCGAILFLSNSSDNSSNANLFLLVGESDPILPEVPYDYAGIELPKLLLETPYGTNDSTVFDDISNDIATLGRVLFYDELLSVNENLSCATCHQQHLSFADDTPFSEGANEETQRNSLHLNDLAWTNNVAFFWDMSHGDLEKMILLPLQNSNEIGVMDIDALVAKMEQTSYYPELFEKAYGNSEIYLFKIQNALTHFIRSMVTFNTRSDQFDRAEIHLTADELDGRSIFLVSCRFCHFEGRKELMHEFDYPSNLDANRRFFSNEMELAEGDIGAGNWDSFMDGLFKVPTLRNIEKTAPYMHDGRFETLREVIDHYSEGVEESEWGMLPEGGFQFTEEEKNDLEAFLLALTDESFLTEVRWSDPFDQTLSDSKLEEVIHSAEVFPNPSNGLTYINFENINQRQIMAYLMTMDGKVVRKLSTHKNGFVTDVSQLPVGMYVVRIKNGEDFIDKKLIVQK